MSSLDRAYFTQCLICKDGNCVPKRSKFDVSVDRCLLASTGYCVGFGTICSNYAMLLCSQIHIIMLSNNYHYAPMKCHYAHV